MTIKNIKGRIAGIAAFSVAGALMAAPMAFAAPSDPWTDYVELDPSKRITNTDQNTKLYRIAGLDRVQTAIEQLTASKLWKDREDNEYVIVARSDDFPDALAAGPLADLLDAPVLVTPSTAAGASGVDSRVVAAIDEFNFKKVIFVGGTGVLPDSWKAQVKAGASNVDSVQRISGATRYDTAIGIAKHMLDLRWDGDDNTLPWFGEEGDPVWGSRNVNIYFATGMNYPDALTAGAAASGNQGIVLLTKDGAMDARTENFVLGQDDFVGWAENNIEYRTVGAQAEAALKGADIRIDAAYSGANRYETSVLVAKSFPTKVKTLTVASGENYPDGVVAGAFAANHDGPLVLTRNNRVPAEVASYIRSGFADAAVNGRYTPVVVFGGDNSVSRDVSATIAELLKV